jgi:hypothetical protein
MTWASAASRWRRPTSPSPARRRSCGSRSSCARATWSCAPAARAPRGYTSSSLFARLHKLRGAGGSFGAIGGKPAERVPALARHRLIFDADVAWGPSQGRRPSYKIFEIVPGATLTGRARPGAEVRGELRCDAGRHGRINASTGEARAGADGRYQLVVPIRTTCRPRNAEPPTSAQRRTRVAVSRDRHRSAKRARVESRRALRLKPRRPRRHSKLTLADLLVASSQLARAVHGVVISPAGAAEERQGVAPRAGAICARCASSWCPHATGRHLDLAVVLISGPDEGHRRKRLAAAGSPASCQSATATGMPAR